VAHAIDDDFTVDSQETMRGIGVFYVSWLHSRVDIGIWFDVQTLSANIGVAVSRAAKMIALFLVCCIVHTERRVCFAIGP
jgi:hypothetical protein